MNTNLITAVLTTFLILNILWIISAAYDIAVKRKNLKLQNIKYKDIKNWIESKGPQP